MSVLAVKKIAQMTGHRAAVFALAPEMPAARVLLSGAGDGWIVRWRLDEPDLGQLMAKVDTQIFSLLLLPTQAQLVAGTMQGGLHWIPLDKPERTKNIAHHRKGVFGMLHQGDYVYTIGGEGRLTRWSALEGRSLESCYLSNQSLRGLHFCPQRNEIAIGASDNAIYLLDAESLHLTRTIPQAHANSVFAVHYSPDGRWLLSGGRDAHLRIWDTTADFQEVMAQPAHWFTINDIAFSPCGRWFATASRDKAIKIWNAADATLLKVLEGARDGGHLNSVNRLLWRGEHLISASDDRTLIAWAVENKQGHN